MLGVLVPRCIPPAILYKGACCIRRLVSGIDITAQKGALTKEKKENTENSIVSVRADAPKLST